MRLLLVSLLGLFLIISCKREVIKPEEVALQAAATYFEQLIHGDYDAYVDGSLKGDTVPPAYRQQLLLNIRMFVERQNKDHKGILMVKPLRAAYDSSSHTVDAFLAISYGDSTQEEIVVPMVERQGVWYLR